MATINTTRTPSMEVEEKTGVKAHSYDGASTQGQMTSLNKLEPQIAAIIATLTPERRAEIEKKLKLKIDLILFPMLLIFYILNYIVSKSRQGFDVMCDQLLMLLDM